MKPHLPIFVLHSIKLPVLIAAALLILSETATNRASAQACSGSFIEHELPHTTRSRGQVVRFYESNGSGVAINDLDQDGRLDIVLGNLDGANQILWNRGDLAFEAFEMPRPTGRTHAVQTLDVDADGWIDIVFTSQIGSPQFWRSEHDGSFTLTPLAGVLRPASVIAWADPDHDGDLDLITASYDAELLQLLRESFMNSGGAGVFYYENNGGVYTLTRLAEESQALALSVTDLNRDGALDLMVGNDFSLPDQSWSFIDGAWQPVPLFESTTYSTMSFDAGDLNNDGALEFFAADMYPADSSPAVLDAWQYVLADLEANPRLPDDRQASRNMLFFADQNNSAAPLIDHAAEYGVSATGWSWSSKFGDLDQDGYLDLYVVNGMASVELFGHLPQDELVEANFAFRNADGLRFVPVPEWGLNSLSGGRSMSMGDLDNDGDLDIVVNNLNSPARLYENQLCGGDSLQVELRWSGSPNLYGIGSRLTLYTSSGTYIRELQAASGYMSGDPARIHYGFPAGTQLERLEVEWTDGTRTESRQFDTPFLLVNR